MNEAEFRVIMEMMFGMTEEECNAWCAKQFNPETADKIWDGEGPDKGDKA